MAWKRISEAYRDFKQCQGGWTYSQAHHYTNPWDTGRTDCSGLVWWLIKGLDPECADKMVWNGSTNTTAMQQTSTYMGRDIDLLEPGDIVLCNYGSTSSYMAGGTSGSHVAMYVGDGVVIDMFPGVNMRERSVWELVYEVGWWGVYRPPYSETDAAAPAEGFAGTYVCVVDDLNVRSAPALGEYLLWRDGERVHYVYGETVVLDDWREEHDGFVWGRYTGGSGAVRYIAVGAADGSETYLQRG